MKILIVLSALVVCAMADCGPLQRLKVKQQWTAAFGTGQRRVDFGIAMWRGMFVQAPTARDVFKRVNGDDLHSPEFTAHSQRVFAGLGMAISALDSQGMLDASLAHLNTQHKEREIPAHYFNVFKKSLMKVVPAAIGRCFDEDAWSSCMDVITDGITH